MRCAAVAELNPLNQIEVQRAAKRIWADPSCDWYNNTCDLGLGTFESVARPLGSPLELKLLTTSTLPLEHQTSMETVQLLLDGLVGSYGTVGLYGSCQRLFLVGLLALPACLVIGERFSASSITPLQLYQIIPLACSPPLSLPLALAPSPDRSSRTEQAADR